MSHSHSAYIISEDRSRFSSVGVAGPVSPYERKNSTLPQPGQV